LPKPAFPQAFDALKRPWSRSGPAWHDTFGRVGPLPGAEQHLPDAAVSC